MTILIHAIGPEIIAYPATLDALRQEFPNCSFPIEPTAEDLAPRVADGVTRQDALAHALSYFVPAGD